MSGEAKSRKNELIPRLPCRLLRYIRVAPGVGLVKPKLEVYFLYSETDKIDYGSRLPGKGGGSVDRGGWRFYRHIDVNLEKNK